MAYSLYYLLISEPKLPLALISSIAFYIKNTLHLFESFALNKKGCFTRNHQMVEVHYA
jgi:hypothetical protein